MRLKTLFALFVCGSTVAPIAFGADSRVQALKSGSLLTSSSTTSTTRAFSGAAPSSLLNLPAGSQAFVRTVDGRQVLYVVPIPAPTAPGPLMIVLDYLAGNPTFMANLVLAGAHAAQGEVLAFPAHQGLSWDNGVITGQFFSDPQSDINFLIDVIADATNNLPVDVAKISMTGYSEGGFMANLFACDRPALLTGFGMVGATQLTTTFCASATPLKMMQFSGTADYNVPYNGFGTDLSAPATLSAWETINRCKGAEVATSLPVLVNDGTSVVRHQIPGCAAILYQIVGGGHNWPGAETTLSTSLQGATSQNIDATRAQWEFFAAP